MSTYEPASQPQFPQPAPQYQPVAANANVAVARAAPAPSTQTFTVTSRPRNYLVLNIITLLFFCFLFGVIGLTYSLKVDSEWNRGNHQGAHAASRLARNWGIAGIVTGIIVLVFGAVVFIVLPLAIGSSGSSSGYDDSYDHYNY